jgi:hypothetical protein
LAFLLSVDPVASVICCMLAHSVTLRRNAKAQIEFEVGRGKVRLVQIGAVAFLRSSIGSLPMLLAMRRASSIVSTFINIGEPTGPSCPSRHIHRGYVRQSMAA